MSRITVFGAGYVGLVTGACFAELGHDVVVRDVVAEKVEALARGEVPIHEPGLEDLLARNRDRLRFTLDVRDAVAGAELIFICVDTPPLYSGDADLSRVWTVIDELPRGTAATLVMKSTVPVGTGEKVRATLDARGLTELGYVSNPEFTAEGTAVRDFLHPDRIVVGAFDDEDGDAVEQLHQGVEAPIVRCDVNSAEMIKLAANAFLMTRVSFVNEIANVCEVTGADVVKVAQGIGLDRRLGPHFLRAGIGYGGSCLVGEESVLVRVNGKTRLVGLERLFAETNDGDEVEVAAWDPESRVAAFRPVAALTRRNYDGDIVELRTKMGRRVRCTLDHPWVTREGLKLAGELTTDDWLPLAAVETNPVSKRFDLISSAERAGIGDEEIIMRPGPLVLDAIGARRLQPAVAVHARGHVQRSHDILRAGALRLAEARRANVPRRRATYGTCRNGTYVPGELEADESFWRIVGLYVAEGHFTVDGRRSRLQWSFHPNDEYDLVEEVWAYWAGQRVKSNVYRSATSAHVTVSSRILSAFWLNELGLGRNCYEQRIPDAIWDAPVGHKRALLSGMWRGDGSWSLVNGGPSVVLEYGTVSRELADGLLRLLADLGVIASLRVARVKKSTRDTYWITVAGADQIEQLLDLVRDQDRPTIARSIAAQAKRIAPTGYRRDGRTAWVRLVEATLRRFTGAVYSLEVPGIHTFVTTGGIATHNCFPKDSLALKQLAANSGYHFQLLNAVIEVNELQKRRVVQKLQKHLGRLRGKRVALLGLAFKPNTDDMREAPSLVLASRLLAEGAEVRAWDPIARPGELMKGAAICDTVLEAVTGADAAVIVTEWDELRGLPSQEVREAMGRPLIVDGRNLLDPEEVRAAGFAYEGIGRSSSPFAALLEPAEPETRIAQQ